MDAVLVVTAPYFLGPLSMTAFAPETGKSLWSSPKTFDAVSYVVHGSSLYTDAPDGLQMFHVGTKGLEQKWSLPLGKTNSIVVAVDDTASIVAAKVAEFDIHTYKEACSEVYLSV